MAEANNQRQKELQMRYIIRPHDNYEKVAMAARIATKFFELSYVAAQNGGFWVSSAGSTANVVAGEISRAVDLPFEECSKILEIVGVAEFHYSCDLNWYNDFYHLGSSDPRWDVRTIVRAAARAHLAPYQPAKRKPLP